MAGINSAAIGHVDTLLVKPRSPSKENQSQQSSQPIPPESKSQELGAQLLTRMA
jgi:hypothetical protein